MVRSVLLAAGSDIVLPVNLVPREVEGKYWRKEPVTHDKAAGAVAPEEIIQEATGVILSIVRLRG